jgi:protein-L-isoaspartate(D-aspartate) O-methyltransferase
MPLLQENEENAMKERNWKQLLERRQLPDLPEERAKMVAALREAGYSQRVLEAMAVVPRHAFVAGPLWRLGYSMIDLWGPGQFIPAPQTIALMLDNLKLDTATTVLECATGSGYLTALLSLLTDEVYTVDPDPAQLWLSSDTFRAAELPNIHQQPSGWQLGWPECGPFSRIVANAAVPQVYEALLRQVQAPGILVAPVGWYPAPQRLIRLDVGPEGNVVKDLGPAMFPPLYGMWWGAALADVPPMETPSAPPPAPAAGPMRDSAWQVWAA